MNVDLPRLWKIFFGIQACSGEFRFVEDNELIMKDLPKLIKIVFNKENFVNCGKVTVKSK